MDPNVLLSLKLDVGETISHFLIFKNFYLSSRSFTYHTCNFLQYNLSYSSNQSEKASSPPMEEDSEEESNAVSTSVAGAGSARVALCHTEGCARPADHSIRRKWLIKMRSSVNKLVRGEPDFIIMQLFVFRVI